MRRCNITSAVATVLFLMLSCGEKLNSQYTLSSDYLDVSDVVIGGSEVQATLHINADHAWAITEDVEWLTVSPVQGSGSADVTLTVGVNPSSENERSCNMVVSTPDGINRAVSLKQGRSDESLSVSINSLSFGEYGGTNNISVTSNTTWTITGGAEWLSFSPATGSGNSNIVLAVNPNTTELRREAVLTVTGSGNSVQTIAVSQVEKTVTLTIQPEIINATAIADDYTFQIQGNATWNITVSDNTWLGLSATNGEGESIITVSLNDNNSLTNRENRITVRSASGTIERTCNIVQAAAAKPEVEATAISNIGRYGATVSSAFSSSLQVTEYGFVWSQTENPTIENCGGNIASSQTEGLVFCEPTGTSGKNNALTEGNFSVALSALKSGATYHVRAFARNAVGVEYGADNTFTTGGKTPGDNDNPQPEL